MTGRAFRHTATYRVTITEKLLFKRAVKAIGRFNDTFHLRGIFVNVYLYKPRKYISLFLGKLPLKVTFSEESKFKLLLLGGWFRKWHNFIG